MDTRRNSPFINVEDKISKLPEPLIHHILSFLDMKYVVQTSVLSRKWRYRWISVPTLTFSRDLFINHTAGKWDSFVDIVDQVLILRDSSDIKKFHLFLIHPCNTWKRLNTWITAAIRHNVQDLSITFDLSKFQFPHCLFTCNSLTKLELSSFGAKGLLPMVLPSSVDLPHLKSMTLRSFSFDNEEVTNQFFSQCPLLESLILKLCKFPKMNLKISNHYLKHFEFVSEIAKNSLHPVVTDIVTLRTPNLLFFKTDDYISKAFSLCNLSSLVTADMYITNVRTNENAIAYSELPTGVKELYADRLIQFLRAVHNVKDLRLSSLYIEFASGALGKLDCQLPQFCNLKCLKLRTSLSRDSLNTIIYMLKITPYVETIHLEITQRCTYGSGKPIPEHPMYPYIDEVISAEVEDYWKARVPLPSMLYHLKSVKILGVKGRINELMFLEPLLKNSVALEQVVVEGCTFVKCCLSNPLKRKRMKKLSEKLLKLPRAAATVSFLFHT